ncbi:MAG TPA: helix-turn-helix domain-containing protein [Phycisphaerae bacterium]|nr:helix-turn-helix domain-containing protein [Phycisphaerae bacterium]
MQPWQPLLVILAGWVNRQQQQVIEYLRTENRVLKEKRGKRRILLNDDQRRRLAVKAKVLGRKVLKEIGALVTPDTILRWRRMLVAKKWDYSDRRKKVGRPAVSQEVVTLVLRMARENPSWGYDRIQGALANLGYSVAPSTVANIMKEHGIDPAPERKRQTTWRTFLKARWDCLGALAELPAHASHQPDAGRPMCRAASSAIQSGRADRGADQGYREVRPSSSNSRGQEAGDRDGSV